jgi:hypothetical protein
VVGLIVIGLPGFELVITFNGTPVDGGLSPEQIDSVAEGNGVTDSYLSFYGIPLFGEPLYWDAAILIVFAAIGFKISRRFRTTD